MKEKASTIMGDLFLLVVLILWVLFMGFIGVTLGKVIIMVWL